jgi:predicted cupin superfamily sugar epimerase
MTDAKAIISKLGLAPHPEGGWYRETWRAPSEPGTRAAGTAILFLLEPGQRSHWHRVDAAELWLFQAGSPLTLLTAKGESGEGGIARTRLGAEVLSGCSPQHLVEPHEWQAAEAGEGWCLVACVVVPAFEFEGFEMAPPGWSPGNLL